MTRAYYNEIDPFAAEWLRNLIDARLIAPGDVDERDIRDVLPSDLAGYTQCHFFAGIGVWSFALRIAGWPDARAAWTGSCPCQPFSAAGRRNGFDDERHLWPAWHHLIWNCRPAIIFGEQVDGKDGYAWLDLVQSDMEGTGYSIGAAVLPVAGFGAPHGRHRLWFVADAGSARTGRNSRSASSAQGIRQGSRCADGRERSNASFAGGAALFLGDTERAGLEVQREQPPRGELAAAERAGPLGGPWRNAEWLWCRDEKWRPVEPGTFPLAHGATARVGRLRAYGNAISPWPASEFVAACMEVFGESATTLLDLLE